MSVFVNAFQFVVFASFLYDCHSLVLEILPSPTVKEYSDVTFKCNDFNASSMSNLHLVHKFKGDTIRSIQLPLNQTTQKVSLQHIGEYHCQAGQELSISIEIVVEAAPKLITPWYSEIYSHVDHRAILSAVFLNVTPINETSVMWSKEAASLNTISKQTLQTTNVTFQMYGKEVQELGTNITLETIVTSSDYGYYDVRACTTAGCSSANIALMQLHSPSPPSELHVTENLTDGFYFQWMAGTNPRGEQMFEITFRRVETSDWCIKIVNDSMGSELPVNAKISGLPETMYEVKVRAAYAHDKDKMSAYTDSIFGFVKGPLQKNYEMNYGPGIGIGIGISVFTVLCVALVVFLIRWKRRRDKSDGHPNKSRSTSSCEESNSPTKLPKSKSSHTYEPPDLPDVPAPSLKNRPRPPVPGGHVNHAMVPEMPRPKAPSNTRQKAAGAPTDRPLLPLPAKKPVKLPLPPAPEEVYEPVEGDGEEEGEGGESGEEYVVPTVPYENMH